MAFDPDNYFDFDEEDEAEKAALDAANDWVALNRKRIAEGRPEPPGAWSEEPDSEPPAEPVPE